MKQEIKNVVVIPENYSLTQKYPVIYLLHGYGNRYDTWINRTKKNLPEIATQNQLIFVCPDGRNSWYWDSPMKENVCFEIYISSELIRHIDIVSNHIYQRRTLYYRI